LVKFLKKDLNAEQFNVKQESCNNQLLKSLGLT